ncbi:MAG: hypothetical protein MJZ34_02295 [Paludibacteraceae bacterium]|nr:hypothetical protein [Paludibacteraceae bacterium]
MEEEIFNEDNPFIRPSPEDIEYYGLDKGKQKVNTVSTETEDKDPDDTDDYDDSEMEDYGEED